MSVRCAGSFGSCGAQRRSRRRHRPSWRGRFHELAGGRGFVNDWAGPWFGRCDCPPGPNDGRPSGRLRSRGRGRGRPVGQPPRGREIVRECGGLLARTGNRAGWLDSPELRAATAPSAGGRFLDRDGVITTAPPDALNKGERGRQFGFRFSVETRRNRSGLAARGGTQTPSFTMRAYSAAESGSTERRLWRIRAISARAASALIWAKVTG